MRILLVTQMYPGPTAPDLGVFVQQITDELEGAGDDVERVVIDHRGGSPLKYVGLAGRAVRAARRFRPDVVHGHLLLRRGAAAALAAGAADAGLVLPARGRAVRNWGAIPGVARATGLAVERAAALVPVSAFLRRELEPKQPPARGKTVVIDSG